MSAFMCSEDHLGALTRYWIEHDRYGRYRQVPLAEVVDWAEIVRELGAENGRSMQARYGERLDPYEKSGPPVTKAELRQYRQLTPVEAIKQARCYQYQSCEHDGWEGSEAHRISEAIVTDRRLDVAFDTAHQHYGRIWPTKADAQADADRLNRWARGEQ